MTFTSLPFFLFFIAACGFYWLLKTRARQNAFLLAASYAFYFWFDLLYGILLILSTTADYFLALGIARRPAKKKTYLWLSLAVNLGGLLVLRYFNFFSTSVTDLFNSLGWQVSPLILNLAAPLGISFYTLKKLSYIIDIYRGAGKPAARFVDFALYVAFFPQIQAGPIDRARNLLHQIQQPRTWKGEWFTSAWPLLVTGLFKKLVIAEGIAYYVDRVYLLDKPSPLMLLSASMGFTLQILADFSAYTDLARGLALLLGLRTPENFKQPYLALTPTDFWARWHITFSEWLRDYIFFPIRRALLRRKGKAASILSWFIPPLAAMLASGLWHGAGWTFMLWGLLHGLWIVAYQALGMGGAWKPKNILQRTAAWLAVFAFLVISWTIFRAPSINWLAGTLDAASFLGSRAEQVVSLIGFSAAAFYTLLFVLKPIFFWLARRAPLLEPLYFAIAAALTILYASPGLQDFIYFRF